MQGRGVDKNYNYKQKGPYRGTAVGVHPVHSGICCADFSGPVPVRALFYIMKVYAKGEQRGRHLVSSYAMGGQEPLTCGITLASPAADADGQTGPSAMRALALAASLSPAVLHFKSRENREISFSVSHRRLYSPEVARGEPENTSSYSISARLSRHLQTDPDVIPRERGWTIVPPSRRADSGKQIRIEHHRLNDSVVERQRLATKTMF